MQSRQNSLLESACNVGSGFVVSLALWEWVVCPLWGIERSSGTGVQITLLFTAVSIIRGYCWRRWFDDDEG